MCPSALTLALHAVVRAFEASVIFVSVFFIFVVVVVFKAMWGRQS